MNSNQPNLGKLTSFLREAYSAAGIFGENIDEKLNICLGNVSCDMDSAIGAILLAYFMSYKEEYFEDWGNYEKFWVPVINCPRSEICARIDISYHLKSFGLDLSKLVYIDDIDINFYAEKKQLRLAIIDHNKLDLTQQQWRDSVVYIVDHHVDLKEYPEVDKVLTFCGSACSLAMNLIFENNLAEKILNKDICNFFSAAILIDTENFKESLKGTKWGDRDQTAIIRMNQIIMKEMYDNLLNKKIDRQLNIELGLELMLRKDYKNYQWKNCIAGISVVFNPLHEIMCTFGVEDLKKTLRSRIQGNGLNIYAIITQIYLKSGEAFREIMIFDEDDERLRSVLEQFEKNCPFHLQKKKFTGLSKNFGFYYIKDESVSRKKIEPIFKEIFEKL
jgi:inorganic pyrophosphatase/exopolyphosphatase